MTEPDPASVNFNFVRNRASELLTREMRAQGFGELPISWAEGILTELLTKDVVVEDVNFDVIAAKLIAALGSDKGIDDEDN